MANDPGTGLLLSDDLLFTSRITGTARDLGYRILAFQTAEPLLAALEEEEPRCLILDLANPTLDLSALLARTSGRQRPRVVAYGSHVDAATLRRARDAGCDIVWPRGKFVDELSRALPSWMAQHHENS